MELSSSLRRRWLALAVVVTSAGCFGAMTSAAGATTQYWYMQQGYNTSACAGTYDCYSTQLGGLNTCGFGGELATNMGVSNFIPKGDCTTYGTGSPLTGGRNVYGCFGGWGWNPYSTVNQAHLDPREIPSAADHVNALDVNDDRVPRSRSPSQVRPRLLKTGGSAPDSRPTGGASKPPFNPQGGHAELRHDTRSDE